MNPLYPKCTLWEYDEGNPHFPKQFCISTNGGDEDWVLEIPDELAEKLPSGIRRLIESYENNYGAGPEAPAILKYPHPVISGWQLWVGCHG